MKNPLPKLIAMLFVLFVSISCKDSNEGGSRGSGTNDGEDYKNEQKKSSVTQTGQNIGNDADSTSIDGKPGNRSNN